MVTHWESSQRPLYVRTVWKDGQHHVILDKNKELPFDFIPCRKPKSSARTQPSRRTSRSANVKISCTKMLLSDVGRFKSVDQQWEPSHDPDFMIKPLSGRPATSCKEIILNRIHGIRPPGLFKTEPDSGSGSAKSVEDESSNALDNPLSNKVLVWLDLASQSGNLPKEVNSESISPVTEPEKCHKLTPRPVSNTCNPCEVVDSSILKQLSESAASGEIIVFSRQEKEVPEDDFYHIMSPRAGDQSVCDEIMEGKKEGRASTAKRQLHIFMPNLPKKTSDCDSSLLSSQISSGFL